MFYKSLIALFTFTVTIPLTTTKVIATPAISIVQNEQNSTELSDRAKQLYLNKEYVEASEVWQRLTTIFERQKAPLNQAMALSNLALTQQQLGDLIAAEDNINSSIQLLQDRSPTTAQQRILASSLDIKGAIERSQGKSKAALATWEKAENIYLKLDNNQAIIKNKLNQAQALQDLGYYRRASKILQLVQTKLINEPNSESKITALLSFGNNLRAMGNIEPSLIVLQKAQETAEELNSKQQNAVLLSLGNTIRALGNRENKSQTIREISVYTPQCLADNDLQNDAITYYLQAIDCYQQAALSKDLGIKTKAQLNLLSLIIENQNQAIINEQFLALIPDLINQIKTNLTQSTITHNTIYDRLNLVQSLICLQPNIKQFSSPIVQQCQNITDVQYRVSWQEIEKEINTALEQAQQLQDKQAQAYALGYMGAVYQQTGKLNQALYFTQQALLITNEPEIAYLWQWQLGRIYQLQNQPELALTAYNLSFNDLQSLRQNISSISPEIQFAFRDRIEPLYRERVALLLNNNPSQTNLIQARDTIEALQLAELNNFFQEACIDATPQAIEAIDPSAAVIYSIILPDRVAVILSQPEKPLKYHQTAITNPNEVDRTFEDLYANLNPFLAPVDPLLPNQTFYEWLIRPLENELETNKTDTLVFILDGVMRGIPVASLHDGEQYLIEKYNLALTPGLQLLTSRALASNSLETIAGGLTESRQGFSSLPSVQTEVTEIASLVPSEVLLNENFTSDRLQNQVRNLPYPIVHLATHGQFSSRAEDTFLLTWSDRINVQNLDQLLQARDFADDTPIELLILSACQTAAGDKQAALGLAGVAVRSGARSTIATLWSIQDDSTAQLMTQFYQALKTPGISKAEALRQAQLSLLQNSQYQHPFYWSAFVLVGNWL